MFNLKGKTAVITGGGSGIGRAIAQLFTQQGAIVHIIDLNEVDAAATIAGMGKNSACATAHIVNVTRQGEVVSAFNAIGQIDILVNNAGVAHIGNVEGTPESDFDRVMNVNVKGAYNCIFAAVPLMRQGGGGVILNMASIAGIVGIPDRFAYSTSKGAILAMTKATAKDYLREGIRCNSISPARVHTPFVDGFLSKNYAGREAEMFEKLSKTQPIGRMAKPEEIAALALYLCSEEAGFITGCDYPIDGGFVNLNN